MQRLGPEENKNDENHFSDQNVFYEAHSPGLKTTTNPQTPSNAMGQVLCDK